MNHSNIGFHTGPGCRCDGIGQFFSRLDAANIPFFLKAVDDYGPAYEASFYSGANHTIVFRLSTAGQNNGYDYDTPPYHLPPATAAAIHWQYTVNRLPPELDKTRVWIEPCNEVDKNRADWLGRFACEIADLAQLSGHKVALFGWSSGEPEPAAWETPGMLAYLQMCAANPQRLAVSLHEYSYTLNIQDGVPHLIGRFQALYDACARNHINRPTTLITEFGWTYNNLPGEEEAMRQIAEIAAPLYAGEVKGAAIWYLGMGYSDIGNKAQRLIAPLTDYNLTAAFPGDGELTPPAKIKHTIHLFPQDYTLAEQNEQTALLYRDRTAFTYSADVAHAVLYAGNPDSKVVIHEPSRWSGDIVAWFLDKGFDPEQIETTEPTIPPPPQIYPVNFGLHASADPGDLSSAEIAMFKQVHPEVIKVLSAHSGTSIAQLSANHPNAVFVVRAFLDFGGRNVSPRNFFDWTKDDVARALNALVGRSVIIELHNEPNLYTEGTGSTWGNGAGFNNWLLQVISLYRTQFQGVRLMYPGLSPGEPVPQIRLPWYQFFVDSSAAANACDYVGAHTYWNTIPYSPYTMDAAIAELTHLLSATSKPVIVTEASNNKAGNPADKGQQYITFWNRLKSFSKVKGVTYFVASASNPAYANEVWLGTQIPAIVAAR